MWRPRPLAQRRTLLHKDRKEQDIYLRALSSLETWYDGKVAVITLTERDYEETGCTKSCTETFADIPRSVRGSVIAVFLYRLPGDPKTHASIRARDQIGRASCRERVSLCV